MQKRFTPDAGGVFPEWEDKTLGECMTLIASKGYKGKDLVNDEDKAIMFSPSDIDTFGVVSLVKNAHISDELFKKSKEALVKNGDILFTKTASIGKVGYVKNLDHNATINPQIVILRANENVDSYFLFCAVRTESFKKQVRKISGGTTIKTMSQEALKELKIKIPKSIEEQRKIAAALAAYDEMIAVKTAKLETWQECKKRMVKEIFGRTKRFKDDDGKAFPEWEEKTLGNVSTVKKGKGYAKKDLTDKGTPIILYGRLYTKYETKIENVDTFADVQKNSIVSIGGEVIIPTSGENSEDIARAAAVEQQGVLIGGDLCVIMPNKDMFDSTFLAYAITYSKSHKDLVKKANGEIIAHLRVEDIKNLSVSLPCTEEQQKIGSFLAEIDKEIEIQKEFIKTYAEGKKRMMMELIEG